MEILVAFSVLAGFLLLGTLMRAKIKWFQYIFLPASVIGGFVGLILGPMIMKGYAIVPIPADWISIFALLPGILIVPVVATVPFGIKFKRFFGANKEISTTESIKKDKSLSRNMLLFLLALLIVTQSQSLVGLSVHYIFTLFNSSLDFYPTFGTEVSAGFAGGHGTAGVIGNLLHGMNQPYWEIAQGVTVTMATFGIILGILIGIVLINIASRRGNTELLSGPSDFSNTMLKGYESDGTKQENFGKETTHSSSIDTLALHFAIIIAGSGLSYALLALIKYLGIPVLESIPIWAYTIIVMYFVWWLMIQFNIDWIIDKNIMSKIASTFTDFAVVAAIISIPVKAVMSFFLPVIITIIIALSTTALLAYWISKKVFGKYWFERSVTMIGTSTGVFITGLLLLKMVDPEYKSPVLTEYSLSYSINSIFSFVVIPFIFGILITQGILAGVLTNIAIVSIPLIILFIYLRRSNKKVEA